jgi:hypothetical protein
MKLIKREPSPAQSRASRANSRRSTGPRTAQGKATASRNALRPRALSPWVARSLRALGEQPGNFDEMHQALAAAMEPRDAWEAAWVQDIARLRARLERLQRAELGSLAVRRRESWCRRQREKLPPGGSATLATGNLIGLVGFTGIADSPMKYERLSAFLPSLRCAVAEGRFERDVLDHFTLLYGKSPGFRGALLKTKFEHLMKQRAAGAIDAGDQRSLLADLDKEISDYEQLEALYEAEHPADDPLQQDAELLLPSPQLDEVIRYEKHLEDQIERKLRQFYARRRESMRRPAEALPKSGEEPETGELASQERVS